MLLPTRIPTSPSNPANQPTEAEDRQTIDRSSDLATSDTESSASDGADCQQSWHPDPNLFEGEP